MFQSGLVSISFRPLSIAEVCDLASRAGLAGVEWGGDVHVPPGDVSGAVEARRLTADHGLKVACYGSYYRAGTGADFGPVLETAAALGSPAIRVWAGEASANCDASRRAAIVADLVEIAQRAHVAGITVATEYHAGTLTDTTESALQMLEETKGSRLKTLWQPIPYAGPHTVEENISAIRGVLPRLLNVHAYYWKEANGQRVRSTMREGREEWVRYLAELSGHDGWALLEFVLDDEPENLIDDARVLNELLRGV